MTGEVQRLYKELLQQYMETQNEENLYLGQQFSRRFIEEEISPEDVISIHQGALIDIYPKFSEELRHSFDFLIEMMIHYGFALREHQSLIRRQEELQMEMMMALKVQETLLKTTIPQVAGLDIGLISKPAKQMSGDYIYFLNEAKNRACVAVADVIGKGIPAAICMSMIKFGMDSVDSLQSTPQTVLDLINRIVEKSVDNSMFISMFYGQYCADESLFTYASAGHEPALHYQAETDRFVELDAKGLLLGVQPNVTYEEKSIVLASGDFIVMMTDGVTESRTGHEFIDGEVIQSLLREQKEESAQVMADHVYHQLLQMQNFQLHDDFTIVIFKKSEIEV